MRDQLRPTHNSLQLLRRLPSLFHPSGGLNYHWRALRYSHTLWQPFRTNIEQWLNQWRPRTKRLILIGPSAGYTLPTSWLRQFQKITAIDFDPLAPWIFRHNHPSLPVAWKTMDIFTPPSSTVDNGFFTHDLQNILQQEPLSAVLLTNIVGQLPLHKSVISATMNHSKSSSTFSPIPPMPPSASPQTTRHHSWQKQLLTLIQKHEWASYHDVYSLQTTARLMNLDFVLDFVADRRDPLTQVQSLAQCTPNSKNVIVDHEVQGLFPAHLAKYYAGWTLTPKNFHLIECVHSGR